MTDVTEPLSATDGEDAAESAEREQARESAEPSAAELIEIIELLFFAYRDFTSDPDAILAEIGFGRAHHRVLHFINRHPGLRVADLLDILKITKQSLARVLKQLVDQGFVSQEAGRMDRRERLLYPTAEGRALAERLVAPQLERIAGALAAAGSDGPETVGAFLLATVDPPDRQRVKGLVTAADGDGEAL